MTKVFIIGGGIAGLSTAYFLAKAGFETIVLEKEKQLGGLGSCYHIENFYIEKLYHTIFKGDNDIIDLLRELGLEDKLAWENTKAAFISKKGIHNFSSPLRLLIDSRFSLTDKVSLASIFLKLKTKKNWEELDFLTAKDWILSHCSENLYTTLFESLLNIKWGSSRDIASAAWLWGRINPRARTRGCFGGNEKMGYLEGSFQALFDSLKEKIVKRGGKILPGHSVTNIKISGKEVKTIRFLSGQKEKTMRADCIVSTIPTPILNKILPLGNIRYKSVVCMAIGLREKLTDYFQIPIAPGMSPFGGIVEFTNFMSSRHYNGHHILYLFNYLDSKERMWRMGDNEVVKIYLKGLQRLFPEFSQNSLLWSRVYRNQWATPLYEKNYLKIMPPMETRIKGLFLVGNFQAYPVSDYNSIVGLSKQLSKIIQNNYRT